MKLVLEVTPPDDHLVRRTVKGETKIFIRGGLKPGCFIAGPTAPHLHFMKQETQDVSQLFRVRGMGDTMVKVVQREHGLRGR